MSASIYGGIDFDIALSIIIQHWRVNQAIDASLHAITWECYQKGNLIFPLIADAIKLLQESGRINILEM
jgi:hypothetical protein